MYLTTYLKYIKQYLTEYRENGTDPVKIGISHISTK